MIRSFADGFAIAHGVRPVGYSESLEVLTKDLLLHNCPRPETKPPLYRMMLLRHRLGVWSVAYGRGIGLGKRGYMKQRTITPDQAARLHRILPERLTNCNIVGYDSVWVYR